MQFVMKKIYMSIFLLFFISCSSDFKKNEKISREDVLKTFNDFFTSVDNDYTKMRNFVTEDFIIYEVGRKWNTDEFVEFVKSFGSFKAKRKFSNIVIDTDINSAHISLEHSAVFILDNPTPDSKKELYYEWIESAYLVKQGDDLKFKFYFSEQIND